MSNPIEGLSGFRERIDEIDAELITLLGIRFEVTRIVGDFKYKNGLPARDPVREEGQLERARQRSAEVGLNPDFAAAFQQLILTQVVSDHEAIRAQGGDKPEVGSQEVPPAPTDPPMSGLEQRPDLHTPPQASVERAILDHLTGS